MIIDFFEVYFWLCRCYHGYKYHQKGDINMKVVIMTDLEGISLVDSIDMMDQESEGYRFACQRLMADVNAAIQGAVDAGADEIIVFDGHGSGHNFIDGELDSRATQKRNFNEPGLFDSCVAYLEIGLHAKPGTINGFLDHVQNSGKWFNYYINGKTYGELAQGAAYCGAYGVPVVMVSGDEAACNEAMEMVEGVVCAAVKKGIGRNRAECLPSEDALKLIRKAACEGIKKASQIKPFSVSLPAELKLELYRTDYCEEILEKNPSLTRLNARTIVKTTTGIVNYSDLLFY